MITGRIVACVIALVLSSLPADARSLVIQSFRATITVNADGTLEVVETIQPRFVGVWNGIFRSIPIQYETSQGFNYTLFLRIDSVTDGAGNTLKYESSRERHYRKLKIWVPGASDAVRTVVLRYRVENGLKFFEEHDELYWNVTGDEWEVPIEQAGATVNLPAGVSGLRAAAFTGGYGSREQAASIAIEPAAVSVQTLRGLNFREGLTAVVGWDPGIVHRPGAVENAWRGFRSNLPLAIPPLAFVGMWWLWSRRGRDPSRLPISARYEPPENLTPAEMGTLVDNSPDMRDITATLVDLAVRGYLVIEEKEEDRLLGLWSERDYVFTLNKPWAEWAGLAPHERKLLSAIFREYGTSEGAPVGTTARLSSLKNRFYKDLPGLKDIVYARLIDRGCYTSRPDRVRTYYLIGAGVIGLIVALAGQAVSLSFGIQPVSAIVAGVLTALIVAGFGWIMPTRTEQGTRTLEASLGFEEFLSKVEADRFERMTKSPALFEKYLPYAMALGVEENWAKAFDDIYRTPPDWYRGTHFQQFHARSLTSNLGQLSTRAAAVMVSAPRSAKGSGFSGGSSGGSSGGGFGGGGGGGF